MLWLKYYDHTEVVNNSQKGFLCQTLMKMRMKILSLVTIAVKSIHQRVIAQDVMSSIHLLVRNVNFVISLQRAMFKIIQYVMIIMKMHIRLIDLRKKCS